MPEDDRRETDMAVAVMKEQMEQNKVDHKRIEKNFTDGQTRIESGIKKLTKNIDDFTESADERYASKTVEKIVYGFVGIVLVSFVGGLIALVWG